MTTSEVSAAPDRATLVARAQEVASALREFAAETEALRRVPDENVKAILDARLNLIGVPLRFGGYDVDIAALHDVAFELGRACGATAWCYSLWTAHTWWSGYWDPRLQQEVYSDGSDVFICSSGFSKSNAEPIRGGYQVSGRWGFSSGCDHAGWASLMADASDGTKVNLLVPSSDFEVQQQTWYVTGLQGTGSKDLVVDDKFVPEYRATKVTPGGVPQVDPAAYANHPQRRYQVPAISLVAWDLVAPALGIAQGTVDEFASRLKGAKGGRSADSSLMQHRIAESTADIAAARALLFQDIEEVQQIGESGAAYTALDYARWKRDRAYTMRLAVQATDRLFQLTGGRALFLTDPMQRMWRDVQAAAHRDQLTFDLAGSEYAQLLLSS